MHRDSDLHGPRKDDQIERELRGMLQGNGPTRAEAWRDLEAPDTDDPESLLDDPTDDTADDTAGDTAETPTTEVGRDRTRPEQD
jgi:hypothetical protein